MVNEYINNELQINSYMVNIIWIILIWIYGVYLLYYGYMGNCYSAGYMYHGYIDSCYIVTVYCLYIYQNLLFLYWLYAYRYQSNICSERNICAGCGNRNDLSKVSVQVSIKVSQWQKMYQLGKSFLGRFDQNVKNLDE